MNSIEPQKLHYFGGDRFKGWFDDNSQVFHEQGAGKTVVLGPS